MSEDQIRQELAGIRADFSGLRQEILDIVRNGCAHFPEHAALASRVETLDKAVSESRNRAAIPAPIVPPATAGLTGIVLAWSTALRPVAWPIAAVLCFAFFSPNFPALLSLARGVAQ